MARGLKRKDPPSTTVFKVIGFFTVATPYEQEAEILKLSLNSLGYPYDIRGVPNLGSWQRNTQYKAEFISKMLLEYPGTPLLYLDVDSIVVRPLLFLHGITGDIAAVHFCNTKELLSGTVYFANNENCRKVVDKWIELNRKYTTVLPDGRPAWDQRTLEMAIKSFPEVVFQELPQEYTWITELTQRRLPNLQSPCIIHTRGAYRFKKLIGE